VEIISWSANFEDKSVNILINYNIKATIGSGTNIMSCFNIPLLPFNTSKDNLLLFTDGTLKVINQRNPAIDQSCFSYITTQ
jgi:hypothetical protein